MEFDSEAKNFIFLRKQLQKTATTEYSNENTSIIKQLLEKSSALLDPRHCINLDYFKY